VSPKLQQQQQQQERHDLAEAAASNSRFTAVRFSAAAVARGCSCAAELYLTQYQGRPGWAAAAATHGCRTQLTRAAQQCAASM
jgi:hypothetical protein